MLRTFSRIFLPGLLPHCKTRVVLDRKVRITHPRTTSDRFKKDVEKFMEEVQKLEKLIKDKGAATEIFKKSESAYKQIKSAAKLVRKPSPEVSGQEGVLRFEIDVSGMKPEEVRVHVNGNVLTIHAVVERDNDDGSKYYSEVFRQITLPEGVREKEVKVIFSEQGILKIEIPYS